MDAASEIPQDNNVEPNKQDGIKKSLDKEINDIVGQFFKDRGIENAIVIAVNPEDNNIALFYTNHFYDATRLLNDVYKQFKDRIEKELS
jgi:hypothetical protein